MAKATKRTPKATREAWRRVNRTQLATLIGCHPDTVQAFERGGMPVVSKGRRGQESVFDAPACLAWWRDRQGQVSEKDAAITRKAQAEAALAEQRHATQQRLLVPREQVVREGQAYTKGWASQVRSIARRARQAGIVTGAEPEAALHDLCTQVLSDIARWSVPGDAA